MSLEILDKVAKFLADPAGCEELENTPSGMRSGHDSLDLHYPTKGVGGVYDSNSSFWDRRRQDYCNLPAALGLIQAGSLGVGGLSQMSRGMGRGIPVWLQRWLSRPKLRTEEFRVNGELRYVVYDEHKFVSSVIFRSRQPKQPISPAQCKPQLDAELRKLEEQRSSSGSLVFRPPTIIELD